MILMIDVVVMMMVMMMIDVVMVMMMMVMMVVVGLTFHHLSSYPSFLSSSPPLRVIYYYCADPNAAAMEDIVPVLDSALRAIMDSMLGNPPPPLPDPAGACAVPTVTAVHSSRFLSWRESSNPELSAAVASSLVYVRERVGVPRDLSVHGAAILRAYINAFLNVLRQ